MQTDQLTPSQDVDQVDINARIGDALIPSGGAESSSIGYRPQINRSSEIPQSDSAAAPMRRKARLPKVIALDHATELRNRDLLSMSNTYLARMSKERLDLLAKKAAKQAKNDPLRWILGGGVNGVGNGIGRSYGKTPLSNMFSGHELFGFVTGRVLEIRGQKRESEGDGSADAQRNVRPRLDEEDQVGRGDGLGPYEDGFIMHVDDVEVGRDATDGVGDVSNFPWNVTASLRGSSVLRGLQGSALGLPGSITGSIGRRGSRVVSASPLHGHARLSGLESLIVTEGFESDAFLGNEFGGLGAPSGDTEFDMYYPGANANTLDMAEVTYQQSALDRENANFLGFMGDTINEKQVKGDQAGTIFDSIEFEELLPPNANSRVVAAHALLRVLTLATKNLISAIQQEEYGAIELRLIRLV
jgi:meiotic recombination protein REC8